MTNPPVDRRAFLQRSAGKAAVGVAAGLSGWLPAHAASHEPIRLGVIGVRSRGIELARAAARLPGVEIAALCDVDAAILHDAANRLDSPTTPREYSDYRQLLDDSRLHALIIATPDHWHASMTIDACRAGKDVYLESPATHSDAEWAQVVAVAARHQRVVQTGLQQRSGAFVQTAVKFLQAGGVGRVRFARAWMACRRKPIGRRGDSPAPAGVDYAAWLGPAPYREFNGNRFHGNWTRFWDYGAGELGLWGVHWLDVAAWALDLNGPVQVSAVGSRLHFADDQETPDTLTVHYQFQRPHPVEVAWEHRTWTVHGNEGRTSGIAFYGDDGTLVLDRGGWKVYDRKDSTAENGGDLDVPHLADFLRCVRTREEPAASLIVARRAEQLCHLGVQAYREQRLVTTEIGGALRTAAPPALG
ncbi:Inositol 2-dehydrogenase [Caulifigura coniformis]|uniref:Inositol 2-dehydrogenase n=1 Tax=Caulifigura coniformis TaxID=2527983 RepID=A0A517S909_9PLAN|nr:Gfo/Idh/MocA family oxidoreductase [Caulifigura coniformis]QDT52614.1 Inositol 2-dehydrogenase [Caulifigura coniformis]